MITFLPRRYGEIDAVVIRISVIDGLLLCDND